MFPIRSVSCTFCRRYVSDHGYDGYKGVCQRKLLSGHTCTPPARSSAPCLLEWRANRKRFNTALEFAMPDAETMTASVESWTRCHSVAAALLADRGVAECHGWTVALDNDQRNGFDYVFDAISEVEAPPGFPGKPSPQPQIAPVSKVYNVYIPYLWRVQDFVMGRRGGSRLIGNFQLLKTRTLDIGTIRGAGELLV